MGGGADSQSAAVRACVRAAVRYFCYGANMAPATLQRRLVAPLASEAGVLTGWQLRMGFPGLPFLEPTFATVVPASPGGLAVGVTQALPLPPPPPSVVAEHGHTLPHPLAHPTHTCLGMGQGAL